MKMRHIETRTADLVITETDDHPTSCYIRYHVGDSEIGNLPTQQGRILEHILVLTIQTDRRIDVVNLEFWSIARVVIVQNHRIRRPMNDGPDTGKLVSIIDSDDSWLCGE